MKKLITILAFFLASTHCFGAYYYGQCFDYYINSTRRISGSLSESFYFSCNIPLAELQQSLIKEYEIATVIDLNGGSDESPEDQKMVVSDSEIELLEEPEDRKKLCPKRLDVKIYKVPLVNKGFNSKETLIKLFKVYKEAIKPILVFSTTGIRKTSLATAFWALEIMQKPRNEALAHLKKRCLIEDYFLIMSWEGKKWLERKYDVKTITRQLEAFNTDNNLNECCCCCCGIFCCGVDWWDRRGRFCCSRMYHINKLERATFGFDEFGRK